MQKEGIIIIIVASIIIAMCKDEQVRPCNVPCQDCPCLNCPEGTVPGNYMYCQCCQTCVIPEGGKCPWTGDEPDSGDVECEVGTNCCNGICSLNCG
ncbi:unnamed protein product [Ceutorhynchus assimilis]|uniref:Uncharacterized protein n=1 Tax=Ceutorhynchus assimilis TaxID=467358 RepID=A0A9N9QSS7_9CUCU|nr:unnamed protein product [Ceutorhynchus assimilis]